MAIVSLDGQTYSSVAVLQLDGFNTSTANGNTTLIITPPTPEVYTAGTNISIASNVISCTLSPLNISIDGANHVPSNLAFVGLSLIHI